MVVLDLEKPTFNVNQIVPASTASRRFGEVRKNAKKTPQFISDNNKIDSVLLNYEEYEKMYMELESLRELTWEMDIASRLENADVNPDLRFSLQDVMEEDEYREFLNMDSNSISDEDLFE